jgi:hypothetical protein
MRQRLLRALVPVVGLVVLTIPGVASGGAVAPDHPAGTACVGGLCDVCPVVAKALTATGEKIYCIA